MFRQYYLENINAIFLTCIPANVYTVIWNFQKKKKKDFHSELPKVFR